MTEQLTLEDFSKNLNTKFKVYRSDEEIFEAELIKVFDLRNDEILNTFAVEFLFPPDFGIEQRIFKMEHPALGTMELFIVPHGKNETGIRYEAIFNQLVQKNV
jgi:hypothetical protein